MKSNGWKHKKTPTIVGTETSPTKMESGQVIINKKATKENLDKLIEINNDGLDTEKSKVSTDGTEGGILKGKPHYDKNGKPLGGIPVIVDGAKKIEVEGEEFVINKEASQKHWKELSKINQSAGNGVPINPSDVGADEDPEEFRQGGTAKIEFNPNHIPNKWIYSYAKKVKEKYPKVWDMGGNIFGNEAFNNLERVLKRGYWTDNEEWMYIKWRSYVARHHKDFRIAGTVAMLKWVDKTDKGWDYMKDLIDKEIAKKYPKKGFKTKMAKGGELIKRADGSYSKRGLWDNIRANIGSGKKPTKEMLEQEAKIRSKMQTGGMMEGQPSANFENVLYRELANRYEHGGGVKDITCRCGWGWNKNQSEKHDEYVCHKCGTDNKMKYGGELAKGIKSEKEHIDTAKKLYNREMTPFQAAESIAREHLKEDPKYYSKMETIDFDKHYDEIKTKYAGGGGIEPTYTLNTPSGDKSRLTYLQQVLVRTSAFKKFFGDWETASKNYLADNKENFKKHFANVSKVMDMSVLEPRVVYHGTQTEKEFFMFDVSKEKGMGRPYAYFAHNKEYSENFTEFSQRNHSDSKPFLYECFLNIRNPFMALGQQYETKKKDSGYWLNAITGTIAWDKYNTIEKTEKTKKLESAVESQIEKYLENTANDVDVAFWTYMARDTKSEFKYFLISYGYDGIFYGEEYTSVYDVSNPKQYTNAVCVFTATDIKLANGKNLNFDPMNADIRYEEGGVPTPNDVTEHNLTAKDKLGTLLFGEKYARGGTAKHADEIMPMHEEETNNNRRFVDELINKMKK